MAPKHVVQTVTFHEGSTEEQSCYVVLKEDDEHDVPMWAVGQSLNCEVCGRPLGRTAGYGFVPYSIDPSTIVLCEEHCKESLVSVWRRD